MQISKTENVIFLRNVESNIIQEAIVILKDNVRVRFEKNNGDSALNKSEICVLKEAENLINSEIDKNTLKFDKFKMAKLERKLKIQKVFNIFLVIVLLNFIIIK